MPSAIIRSAKGARSVGIGDDDVADMRAGDVEGLGGRGHHHQPVGDLGRCQRHRQCASDRDRRGRGGSRPRSRIRSWRWQNSATSRNSSTVQTRPPGLCGEQRISIFSRPVICASQASKSICVAPSSIVKRAFDHLAARGFDDAREGVVDRGHQDDAVAGCGDRLSTQSAGAVDQAVGGEDPVGLDVPAVAGLHPPADRLQIGAVVAEVAVDPMRRHRLAAPAGRQAGGRNSMSATHIARPVIGRNAVERLHHVPFRRNACRGGRSVRRNSFWSCPGRDVIRLRSSDREVIRNIHTASENCATSDQIER